MARTGKIRFCKKEDESDVGKCHLCKNEKVVKEVRRGLFLCKECEEYLLSLRKKSPLFLISE